MNAIKLTISRIPFSIWHGRISLLREPGGQKLGRAHGFEIVWLGINFMVLVFDYRICQDGVGNPHFAQPIIGI